MKREISITQPEYLVQDLPGKYDILSWLEYIVTVPNPIFIVTRRKANAVQGADQKATTDSLYTVVRVRHEVVQVAATPLRSGT